MTPTEYLWRPDRDDFVSIAIIVLLPALVALPQLTGVLHANPMLYIGNVGKDVQAGWFPGTPYADPNVGFQSQALGRLAMEQWLGGIIPWWNSYSGIGVPLAGEYQPAIFSPLSLPLLFSNGIIWQHLLLQILSGWGCFALLRQIGLGRLACLTGAVLFSQNGTLAWFAHAPAVPVAWLPWVLLGINRAAAQTRCGWQNGWRLFAISVTLMLLSGFPETEYLNLLFSMVWAGYNLIKMPSSNRLGFVWRLTVGAVTGLALTAPQILVFFEFLPNAMIGSHAGALKNLVLGPLAIRPSLLAPYMFGPIFAYPLISIITEVWDFIGGYVDSLELTIAAYGLWHRRDSFCWMLVLWSVLAIGKTFGVQPLADVWNLMPGISDMMFCRYVTPTWELAITILVAFGVDALAKNVPQQAPILVAGSVSLMSAILLWALSAKILPYEPMEGLRIWTSMSVLWSALTSCLAISALVWFNGRLRAALITGLLVLDATIMFAIPTLSNPRNGTIDTAAIEYLQRNLGFERFYTLGPIAPNFSAYFNIASINENYIPLPKLWGEWLKTNLDPVTDPLVFTGFSHPDLNQPTPAQEFNSHLSAYEDVGVKYVVTPAGLNPFIEAKPSLNTQQNQYPKVYSDSLMDIYQLPAAKPYFETPGASCTLQPQSRTKIIADCATPATLVRRELFFPGWRAEINGHETPIIEQNGLFEAINLPAGQSKITYSYAPLHIIWAWLLMALALITLITPSFIRRPKTI